MRSGGAGWISGLTAVALVVAGLLTLLIIGSTGDDDGSLPSTDISGVNEAKIPQLARDMMPVINDVLSNQCPELPAVWVIAEVMAESGWHPQAWSNDGNGGAAGLYQLNQRNWISAGGRPWVGVPPGPTSDIYQPETQLRIDIPWVCANLRGVTGHLRDTHKPITPLDAMAVCHVAGCGRVTRSASGIPTPGEAGCGVTCVSLIHRYINNIHRYVQEFSAAAVEQPPTVPEQPALSPTTAPEAPIAPPAAARATDRPGQTDAQPATEGAALSVGGSTTSALPAAPAPYTGPGGGGCTVKDPTSNGCLTPTTWWALNQEVTAFGPFRGGPTLRDTTCWFAPAWNPNSDQAQGQACDLFPGPAGAFAAGPALARGWRVANWLRSYAGQLRVAYVIWQGRYWQPGTADQDGWGQPYNGGGVYDVQDPNGGNFDHVHVGFAP
jgi:hypothetical protein